MAKHVACLGADHQGGFKHIALGRPPLLDGVKLFLRPLREHILKELIQVPVLDHGSSGGPPLIEDGNRGSISLRLANRIGVDEFSKDVVGPLLVAHDNRRSRETDASAIGQSTKEIRVQGIRLRAVRLIDQDHNVVALVK